MGVDDLKYLLCGLVLAAGPMACDVEPHDPPLTQPRSADEVLDLIEGWEDWSDAPGWDGIAASVVAPGAYVEERLSPAYVRWIEEGAKGPIPDDAAIVRPVYETPDPESIQSLTVMVRGGNSELGGWEWAKLGLDGEVLVGTDEGGEACASCHIAAADNDYMLGFDVGR